MATNLKRRHVVCLPFPAQSHIGAMLKLAKLLHHRGFHVSFINTEFNHRRMLKAQGPSFADDLPRGFRFLAIPDGLPPSQSNATQALEDLCLAARDHIARPFCDLIGDLNRNAAEDSGDGDFPAVSCVISDAVMIFSAWPAAEKYELPIINLVTISACALMAGMQYPALVERGLIPVKDHELLEHHLDTIIDWIPGMKNMRLRDLSFDLGTMDPNNEIVNFSMEVMQRIKKATATIIHTFETLEQHVLDALSSTFSGPVYAVGPLHILLKKIPEHENQLKHIGGNLWKEDMEWLTWLNNQKVNSVIYINFGSITHLTHHQVVEFAMGIASSKQPFLWIVRPDLVMGDSAILPVEFIEETKGRCLLLDWCPQEEVLNHPSIGGFLTHCGWNSTIESLSFGVPMLCWPCGGDQEPNCRYVCAEWLVGLHIDKAVTRDKVESLVRELMVEEKGKQLRMSAVKWKKLAEDATDGSSSMNLHKLFDEIVTN